MARTKSSSNAEALILTSALQRTELPVLDTRGNPEPSHFEDYRDALEHLYNNLVKERAFEAACIVLLKLYENATKVFLESRKAMSKAGIDTYEAPEDPNLLKELGAQSIAELDSKALEILVKS